MELKRGVAKCATMATQLQQVIDFTMMPSGQPVSKVELDLFLKSVAEATRDFNIFLETTKGELKAMRN